MDASLNGVWNWGVCGEVCLPYHQGCLNVPKTRLPILKRSIPTQKTVDDLLMSSEGIAYFSYARLLLEVRKAARWGLKTKVKPQIMIVCFMSLALLYNPRSVNLYHLRLMSRAPNLLLSVLLSTGASNICLFKVSLKKARRQKCLVSTDLILSDSSSSECLLCE